MAAHSGQSILCVLGKVAIGDEALAVPNGANLERSAMSTSCG